jgi:hypothetical protein
MDEDDVGPNTAHAQAGKRGWSAGRHVETQSKTIAVMTEIRE